jgi:hypothetical protein
MKSQKTIEIVFFIAFVTAFFGWGQAGICAEGAEKEWIGIHEQIPEGAARYKIKLKYRPTESGYFYSSARGSNVESDILPDGGIDGYEDRLDFGTQFDGYQYVALVRAARDLSLLNRDGRQICKTRIIRSIDGEEQEIVKEGYFFPGNQFEIPAEIPGEEFGLDLKEPLPSKFSINIYGNRPNSYRGSLSARIKGSLTGSIFTSGANLGVSVSYKDSFETRDAQIKVTLEPFDDEVPYDSAGGSITDILRLHSTKLVVEKIATDSSEIILAAIHGDLAESAQGQLHLGINKPVPAFSRVELIGRKLLTLDQLCKKAGRRGYIVMIFGDLKRQTPDYYRPDMETSKLTLDESMIMDILQRDSKTGPIVAFVCREILFADLYEKWLGQDPGFYILSDYSDPMEMNFLLDSRRSSRNRPPTKPETLRGQLLLPENNVSIALVNGEGNLIYIDINAAKQLEESLTRINKLIREKNR